MASSSNSAFASTSTADGNSCYEYDVFLNHRGPDVKKRFASHLYRQLKANGLRVFLDQEELQKGDELTPQIKGAIRDASVQIAIFSLNYCDSPWCLNELLLMLESKEERGSTIIPVFYGVKPSELRWTQGDNGVYARTLRILEEKLECIKPWLRMLGWTRGEIGVYARALRILEEKKTVDGQTRQNKLRYQPETIKKWRDALHDVAEITGFELEAKYGGDEGQLLDDVVEQVLKIVPKPPLYVSKYPTGLNGKIKEFKESVLLHQHENGEARVVGIVGLGGVGKTTLSKEFFNGERKNYRRSSFLSDVREEDSRGSLKSLQSQLIKDLTQRDEEINNTNEGIPLLKRYLSHSHALIILDDVDRIDQLEALVSPAKDVLDSNSLVVVTSRDKGVLKRWGIDDSFIYELKGLDPQHSNELFCWHAFHRPRPDAGFEEVVKGLVAACHELPLSLKVIGALLYGEKNRANWSAQLSKLSEILPADIQNTLKVSYDRLDNKEKQIFLDTACFFIGKEKETAIRIWDGSGWHGSLGLQNLQNKCLVEVKVERVWDEFGYWSDAECIRMHDHVRDLGRSLADKEPLRRIWRVAESLLDQSHVRGVKTSAECDGLVTELRRKGSCVESVFSVEQAEQLILLRWYKCPYSSLDSKISTENLRILYIEGRKLEKLWESQAPLQLRELYIKAYRLSKIPEFIGQLKHLEKIVLRGSDSWKQVRMETLLDGFCQLASLKHLELSHCKYLRSLPDSFGNLTSLQHISFDSCNRLEMLPDSFGKLTKLQHLFLTGSYKLQMLPDSLGNLAELQRINLTFCDLEMLPNSFGNLTKLQHIDLNYCTNLQMLPNSFGNLTKLQHIGLKKCTNLQMLPNSFGNLTKLQHIDLNFCTNLQMLPNSFGNLKQLKFLGLASCKQLTVSSETLGNITTLEHFSLSDSSRPCLKVLPSQLTYQQSLQSLFLGFDFKELPTSIGNLSNLKVLRLESSCLEMLPPSFGDLRSLEELILVYCPLKGFPDSIRKMTQLKKLRISYIKNLREIKECPSREVGGSVETANDSRGHASEASYSNAVFPNLQHLHIDHCDRLVEVGALPTTLQTLVIQYCGAMEEMPSMETLVSLEDLKTDGCRKLKRIHGLAQLTELKELVVNDCSELEELPGVEHSRSLESVFALYCPKLQLEYQSLQRTCKYFRR